MESWFSKCTKVLMNIHKIEDENCRTYIFEYFFKFLSYRFSREPRNTSIRRWILSSKFDMFVYLLFMKQKYLNQDLFDHMSEAFANLFTDEEILAKFDYFLLISYYEQLYGNMRAVKPHSVIYLVGILYCVYEQKKIQFSFENIAEAQAKYIRTHVDDTSFQPDGRHNRLFATTVSSPRKKDTVPQTSSNTLQNPGSPNPMSRKNLEESGKKGSLGTMLNCKEE